MERIHTDKAPKAIGPYSQATISGNLIFVSGQISILPETNEFLDGSIVEQTRQVLNNIKSIVEEAGSSMDRVVKTTVFLSDLADFSGMNRVYSEYLPHNPARATLQASLPKNARVEIEAIAER